MPTDKQLLQKVLDNIPEEHKLLEEQKRKDIMPVIDKFISDNIDITDTFFMATLADTLYKKVILIYKQKITDTCHLPPKQ